jgi:hypothetical protein
MSSNYILKRIVFGVTFLLLGAGVVSGVDYNVTNSQDEMQKGWTITEVVSTESTSASSFPSVAVDYDGTVHVAWRDLTDYGGSGTDFDIFYKHRDSSGAWSTAEVVSTESTEESREPSIAVDPTGKVHVAWCDYTNYGGSGTDKDIFYKYRNLAGSWSTTEIVSAESTDNSYAPSIAVETDGTVHIAWYDKTDYAGCGSDYDIFYKTKAPSGTWAATEVVSTESTGDSDNPSLFVDSSSGKAHIAWDDDTDYNACGTDFDIFYKNKDILNNLWTTTEVVSSESTGLSLWPTLKVDSDSNIHVAWDDWTDYDHCGVDEDIFYKAKKSNIWSITEVVSTESTEISYQSYLDATSSNVYVAWKDSTNYGGSGADADIFYKTRDLSSWGTSEVVSTESTGQSEWPFIIVDAIGTAHVAWGDMTDYNGAGSDNDVFYKNSSAGGGNPDLLCSGSLSWSNVKTGSQVTGTFTVENNGDPGSLLDWEVAEWPSWGIWVFDPGSGAGLKPSDGPMDILVLGMAPGQQNQQFTGKIRVNSLIDATDYCEIDVYLKTPRHKLLFDKSILDVFEDYIGSFPMLHEILKWLGR